MNSENKKKSEAIRLLKWLLKAGISLGLIVLLLWHANLNKAVDSLARLDIGWFLLAVLIKGTGILAGVIRWQILLIAQNLRLRFTNLGGAYLIGRFFGSFLPSTIGLDVYRTYFSSVRTRKVARCVAVTAVEKVIGLFALSLLALLAIPFGVRLLHERTLWILGLAMCAPIGLSSMILLWPGLFLRIAEWFRQRNTKLSNSLGRLSEAVGRFGQQRIKLAQAVLLGLVVHGGTSAMYVATARAVGVDIPAYEILFIGPLMIAATLVPISIAGIGVRETTYVYFLSKVGVPTELAILLGFLGFLAGEIYSLAGGIVWFAKPASRPDDNDSLGAVVNSVAAWARNKQVEVGVDQ